MPRYKCDICGIPLSTCGDDPNGPTLCGVICATKHPTTAAGALAYLETPIGRIMAAALEQVHVRGNYLDPEPN
jgi:hypothetical protein